MTDQLAAIRQAAGADWLKTLRREALDIFDATVPIDDADGGRIEDVIAGRKMLGLMLSGYGKGGGSLYDRLNQPKPESKKGRADA